MDHDEIRLRLAAYLDNAVTDEEKGEIKKHLGMCGRCRGDIADLELTVRYLKDIPEVEPPSWLSEKIMADVMNAATQKKNLWQSLFFPLHVKLPLEVFAIIFICITGYYLAFNNSEQPLQIATPPVAQQNSTEDKPTSKALPEEHGAPILPRTQTDVQRKKEDFSSSTDTPEPVLLPSDTVSPKAPAPIPSPTPAARMPLEPELQPIDEGFMSDTETTLPRRGEQISRTSKVRKESTSANAVRGKGVPATQSVAKEEITLRVDDPDAASVKIEDAVTHYGGKIKGHSDSGDIHLLIIRIGSDKYARLLDRLGRIGTILERPQHAPNAAGTVEVIIKW